MSFIAGVFRNEGDPRAICLQVLHQATTQFGLTAGSRVRAVCDRLSFGLLPEQFLPEDSFDFQPLSTERFALVGDVRLDNRSELQTLLGIHALEFAGMADSQVFLACWQAWGIGCVERLCGGFAVAVWDVESRSLWLIRDHAGERPVYYADTRSGQNRGLVFASMPGPLRRAPGVDGELDEDHVVHYLAMVPELPGKTFFRHIQLLPPGHFLKYRDGEAAVQSYWHPSEAPAIRYKANDDYVKALQERFDLAVKARLRTRRPIGAQLSGGMDSSSVTATAALLLDPTRLTAFTAVPQAAYGEINPEGRFGNEGPAAARVAAMYPNIEHVFIEPSGADLFGTIKKTATITNAPVFNPMNQMWLNRMYEDARARGIQVMLQGTCGNATVSFGGLIGLSDLLRAGRLSTLFRQVRELRKKGHTSWRGGAYWAVGASLPMAVRRLLSPEIGKFDFAFSAVHPERARALDLKDRAFAEFFTADKSSADFRRKMFDYYDVGFANAATSLGWGISLRDPMQDKRIFEYCFAIPIEQYLAEGQSRSLVRRAMRDRLPPEILSCTTRGLQAADWYLTMGSRLPQMREELDRIRRSPMAMQVLDVERLQRLLAIWPSTGFERPEVSDSWHLALMRGLAVGSFVRHNEVKP